MNFNDTEIVMSVLENAGFKLTTEFTNVSVNF